LYVSAGRLQAVNNNRRMAMAYRMGRQYAYALWHVVQSSLGGYADFAVLALLWYNGA